MVPTCRQEWDKLRKNREGLQKFPLDRVSSNLTHLCCRKAVSIGKLRRDSSSISLYFWDRFCLNPIKNTQNRSNKWAYFPYKS
ncbi:unnamed protein product [Meloidogyne enterolobii]|uniref:Uncharacterized protein n=1 Tax=Meloidogyne enterolobii TaxID=390850 RepID=A0ACB0ZUD9_MELEN